MAKMIISNNQRQSPLVVESTIVFLPYVTIRPFFPKNSFCDSLNKDKKKSDENKVLFVVVTYIIKDFYL